MPTAGWRIRRKITGIPLNEYVLIMLVYYTKSCRVTYYRLEAYVNVFLHFFKL
jgi:hypothetical protein